MFLPCLLGAGMGESSHISKVSGLGGICGAKLHSSLVTVYCINIMNRREKTISNWFLKIVEWLLNDRINQVISAATDIGRTLKLQWNSTLKWSTTYRSIRSGQTIATALSCYFMVSLGIFFNLCQPKSMTRYYDACLKNKISVLTGSWKEKEIN